MATDAQHTFVGLGSVVFKHSLHLAIYEVMCIAIKLSIHPGYLILNGLHE